MGEGGGEGVPAAGRVERLERLGRRLPDVRSGRHQGRPRAPGQHQGRARVAREPWRELADGGLGLGIVEFGHGAAGQEGGDEFLEVRLGDVGTLSEAEGEIRPRQVHDQAPVRRARGAGEIGVERGGEAGGLAARERHRVVVGQQPLEGGAHGGLGPCRHGRRRLDELGGGARLPVDHGGAPTDLGARFDPLHGELVPPRELEEVFGEAPPGRRHRRRPRAELCQHPRDVDPLARGVDAVLLGAVHPGGPERRERERPLQHRVEAQGEEARVRHGRHRRTEPGRATTGDARGRRPGARAEPRPARERWQVDRSPRRRPGVGFASVVKKPGPRRCYQGG